MSATDLILWLLYSLDGSYEERRQARETANAWLANYCRRPGCDDRKVDDRQLCRFHLDAGDRNPEFDADREKLSGMLAPKGHRIPDGWEGCG